jgi:hypothetical protein
MSTNNKRRRRAPGGGRKPKGRFVGNTERINVRYTPAIKTQLEIAAAKNGRSLPQEIQERLERTFDEDAYECRDPAMTALLCMVGRAASQFVRGGKKDLPAWRTDPSEFEGFKAAIDRILERLRPLGHVTEVPDVPNSPLNRARYIEWSIFDCIPISARPKHITDDYRKAAHGRVPDFPLGSTTQRAHQEFVEQEDARSAALRDLGLKK